jgi:hypothetical protein
VRAESIDGSHWVMEKVRENALRAAVLVGLAIGDV